MSVISRNGAFQPQKLILLKLISAVGMAGYITLHINAVSSSFSKEISDYDLERIQGSSIKKNTTIRTRRDALRTITPVMPNHDHTTDMDVIVYLAQFGHHSSYGQQTDGVNEITGTSKLNHSLTTLYENYVNYFPCDVIVFYSEDDNPDSDLLQQLKMGRPRLKFKQLDEQWWSLPPGISLSNSTFWILPGFSVGYRHMIRWYSKLIWSYLHGLGYTHVMRMDDDSYIYSTIKYNLFEYMRDRNKRYAFRQPCTDWIGLKPLNALMDEFLKDNPNATTPELLEFYRQDRQLGFYNNWFMADISFFLSPPASTFLDIVDRSHIMYTHRTGDLSIQSAVVRLFLQPKEIQWFQDFTYQHVTISRRNIKSGCPSVGALTRGEGTDLLQWRTISERFNSSFDPACDIRITARKNVCAILHFSGEMPRLVCPPNSTYDCVGAEMCAMESLGLKEGHYLNEIVQNSKTW